MSSVNVVKPATAETVNGLHVERFGIAFGDEANRPAYVRQQDCIRAEIFGSATCQAAGLTARGAAPVLSLCRALIEAGHDPTTPLEAWRGTVLALRIRSIGEGAQFEVADDRNGRPRFRRRRDRGDGAGSPVAQFNRGSNPRASRAKRTQGGPP